MQPARVRVIIADDHPLIRLGVRKLLEASPEICVVAEASDGKEAVEFVHEYHPDVLILDLQMPIMDGIQAMECLRQSGSKVRILILSAFSDEQYYTEVLALGAWGYYLKEDAPTMIVEAVRQAARGDGKGTRPRPNSKLINHFSGIR